MEPTASTETKQSESEEPTQVKQPEVKEETKVELFPEQQAAKDAVLAWFESINTPGDDEYARTVGEGEQQVFRLFGYAGVGKTTIIREILREIDNVVFGAFTGKAAFVMRRNGLPAKTIHSLIYKPVTPDKQRFNELKKQRDACEDKDKRKELSGQMQDAQKMTFEPNDKSAVIDCNLVTLDECSMVDEEMAGDLKGFGKAILVLGDPGQLPPIHGQGAFTKSKPDILLEKIHRQALDNPIINLSFRARTGNKIPHMKYGDSQCVPVAGMTEKVLLEAHQIITGKNVTRMKLNQQLRTFKGYHTVYPVPGEKLICLRNAPDKGLFNGMMVEVIEIVEEYAESIEMRLLTEEGREVICPVMRAHFDEYHTPGLLKSLEWWDFQDKNLFDFGYAITVHKSQGSQWDNVVFVDDKFFMWKGKQKERKQWLYTGITRAAETLTLVS